MYQRSNLASQMEKQLPAKLVEFMQQAGLVAASQGQSLYLVGGVVRDLFLGRANLDLDLAVTGNAIVLAGQLAQAISAKLTANRHFFTAKLTWDNWVVDLATTRSETYARPGALPRVQPASIEDDLFRRDFTINAMAVELVPSRWGRVIDLYGGRSDLENGLLRVLHEDSFIDDATRVWRGLRYEQRLGFKFEPTTLSLLKRDVPMLETISGDRTRHELELVLSEEFPEKVILRADKLKVLPEVHPGLKGDAWLARMFQEARNSASNPPLVELYLALLAYRLTKQETKKLISQLRLRKSVAQTLEEGGRLRGELLTLAKPALAPSRIYSILHEYTLPAVSANYIAADFSVIKKHINLYLTKLRYVKPALTGRDLVKLGVTPGPEMKKVLRRLLEARMDGEVKDKQGEVGLVEMWKK